MAISDAPIPKGLYSDGKHWIYFKNERNPSVIEGVCGELGITNIPDAIVEITSITMYDFSRTSFSEMIKLMKEFLLPYKGKLIPVVWQLSVEHDTRLTKTRKSTFLRTQKDIAHSCKFIHVDDEESTQITNKYYYYN